MRRFTALFGELDARSGTTARVETLAAYFATADPADAAWALHLLLGKQRRRLITGRRLRQIALEGSALPEWLFDDCYAHVGDTAETIALLWQQLEPETSHGTADGDPEESLLDQPLHRWLGELLPAAAALEGAEQAQAVRRLWQGLEPGALLVANKLLTGGFRLGVAQGLVLRALSQVSGLEPALLAHRLMGGLQLGGPQRDSAQSSAAAWNALLAPAGGVDGPISRPYPFCLASPVEPEPGAPPLPGPASDWLVEWKWDGIRGQLIRRGGEGFLWSRGEELINAAFPELIAAAGALPCGTVLDGEVLVWPEGAERPAPFAQLQRRLGRRAPGRALLAEAPAVFMAYDLLERDGEDWRPRPLSQRRAALDCLLHGAPAAATAPEAGLLRLSPLLSLPAWDSLESLRQQARAAGAEGLMLKAAASPYRVGRRRGDWWKHKLEPLRLDAVLVYAQAGSGRRANLFTDYTFALWSEPPRPGEPAPALVTFAKAYSGLDDGAIAELDRWIRSHTIDRFGPVRAVEPLQVFELAFEGLQPSRRHRSGIAVRFPRIARWRRDKPAQEADTLASALALLQSPEAPEASGDVAP
ncbi:ATP-dependent DNA ligase [Vulcanococcus limneticus Candia 3F8]|uniref:ATP-dependent DNA ligase n=1 Tax=Vulcanococcus limneticus TaxID=2170428 RepID=UPI000B987874|nr:ATP-dependent DNA ligase [Vulcanococcus limneticus]MCP9791849.1 ATP-dependent DNA ligase [Vulcanococcus limneticus MW73D5]MCP9894387.1 ATP-dependent DNA ligase [Vulcanococcus limneticus Candia 3F8]MCP9897305.1 ATP-dependent DNA ligase [Vulcanococcus limneticus Candia 3B3]